MMTYGNAPRRPVRVFTTKRTQDGTVVLMGTYNSGTVYAPVNDRGTLRRLGYIVGGQYVPSPRT